MDRLMPVVGLKPRIPCLGSTFPVVFPNHISVKNLKKQKLWQQLPTAMKQSVVVAESVAERRVHGHDLSHSL